MNKELIEKLLKECTDLGEKTSRLFEFIYESDKNGVSQEQLALLHIQYSAMTTYLQVLNARIDLLKSENQTEDDSMKITINIPKEFIEHFNRDKFEDSFKRIRDDLDYNLKNREVGLAGNYEIELISMLIEAFKNAKKDKESEEEE